MKLSFNIIGAIILSIMLQACNKDITVDGGGSATTDQKGSPAQTPNPSTPELILSSQGDPQNNTIDTDGTKGNEQDFFFSLNAKENYDLQFLEAVEMAAGCATGEITKNYVWLTMKDAHTADGSQDIKLGDEFRADTGKNYLLMVHLTNLGKCTSYQLNFVVNQN